MVRSIVLALVLSTAAFAGLVTEAALAQPGHDEPPSPIEALDERSEEGFGHVIDVPYEFDSDSRDTLIVLRQGYQREIPDRDGRFESRFADKGVQVKITNASFGGALKTRALETVIGRALEQVGAARGGDTGPPTRAAAGDGAERRGQGQSGVI